MRNKFFFLLHLQQHQEFIQGLLKLILKQLVQHWKINIKCNMLLCINYFILLVLSTLE